VHGLAGIFGTLSLGLFATGQYGASGPTGADNSAPIKGLFWGGGGHQLWAQFYGSITVTAASFGIGMVLMLAVKATRTLRISEAGELEGIDIHEHGSPAYHPEFAFMGQASYSTGPTPAVPSPMVPQMEKTH
jgi:ammonium transporter, Amt family